MQIIGVLLPLPFHDVFDYKAEDDIKLGDIVKVPFGRDKHFGVVWKLGKSSNLDDKKIKPMISSVEKTHLSKELMKFVDFVAEYNMAYKGLVLKMILSQPQAFENKQTETFYQWSGKTLADAKLKNSDARWRVINFLNQSPPPTQYLMSDICQYAGVSASVLKPMIDCGILTSVTVEKKKEFHTPNNAHKIVELNQQQKIAADELVGRINQGFSVTLLDGITGSGKTEVYFEAIAAALENEKQVLILVPEIALTSQWLSRFENRFGVKPAAWHSGLSPRERQDNYLAIAEGRAKVIIGARSALFLPYQSLNLVVIDESHDHSFKQEEGVNYQGRDMAVVRAKLENIPVILSTATPSLETIQNVEDGKYNCVKLTSRYSTAVLPEVKIIDLKKDKPQKIEKAPSWISPILVKSLEENLARGEQSMLFLNRRGYAPLIICRDCGYRIQCPHCTAWMNEHRRTNSLICHQCGHTTSIPKFCPDCGSENGLTACGPGVERINEEIKTRFPTARTAIISSDITSSLKDVSDIIKKMENNEIDILVGTQILAKGHNFPGLTLIGIIDADLGLMGSDLRATERTFQLLSQVSGRAGRGKKKGTVYVQTLYPENAVLNALINNDREKFLSIEKKSRQLLKMPPFGKLAAIIITGTNKDLTEKIATSLGKTAPNTEYITTLGPAPAPIHMLRSKYRYRLLLKTNKHIKIQNVLREWLSKINLPSTVKVEIDIDPYSFM